MNNEAQDVSAGRENSTLALYVTLITVPTLNFTSSRV